MRSVLRALLDGVPSTDMQCPFCAAGETKVVDSRPADHGTSIRRRRECLGCERRFTTYERMDAHLMVRKRNGVVEPFRSEKLRRGLESALADRPVESGTLDEMVATIERAAHERAPLVDSDDIGRAVLQNLRQVDEVAYLRFASVYKDFQGASDFEREMASLETTSGDS